MGADVVLLAPCVRVCCCMSYLNETGHDLTEEQQIQMCLNCKRSAKMCRGDCEGLTNSTTHRLHAEDIDALILKHFDHCEFFLDLVEATGIDKTTIRNHCKKLGLDLTRFYNQRGKRRIKHESY